MTPPEPIIIRHLGSLVADIQDEVRQILFAIYEYERGMPASGPPEDVALMLARIEMKARNALQYLTGSRE